MKVPSGYTGHARDAAKLQVVPDPKVKIGPFRILQRTDGLFVIFDPRLPAGASVDGGRCFVGIDDARRRAEELVAIEGYAPEARAPGYDADAESFAGMKRALTNGFAKHEPAYSTEELAALRREEARGVADRGPRQ